MTKNLRSLFLWIFFIGKIKVYIYEREMSIEHPKVHKKHTLVTKGTTKRKEGYKKQH